MEYDDLREWAIENHTQSYARHLDLLNSIDSYVEMTQVDPMVGAIHTFMAALAVSQAKIDRLEDLLGIRELGVP